MSDLLIGNGLNSCCLMVLTLNYYIGHNYNRFRLALGRFSNIHATTPHFN